MKKLLTLPYWAFLIVGAVVGIIGFVGVRMATLKTDQVHYHANFALYVNGVRDEFKSPLFYEEVQSCTMDSANDPKVRAHMHDQNNHVVHVHAKVVTWGDFFANIGYTLGNTMLKTEQGGFVSGQDGNALSFMLNGQKIDAIANRVIGDRDRLLVSYGHEDQTALQKQFASVESDALEHDQGSDPATCKGSEPLSFTTRLKKVLGIGQ
jgi:hypothetical protein